MHPNSASSRVKQVSRLWRRVAVVPSRAEVAWHLYFGDEKDPETSAVKACEVAQPCAERGCAHCIGVASFLMWCGAGWTQNKEVAHHIARKSSDAGSRCASWLLFAFYC